MGYYRDSSGVGDTCPKIDKVIKEINSFDFSEHEDNVSIGKTINYIETLMEEIRSDNSDLREWGTQNEQEHNYALEEIDNLKNEITTLQNSIILFQNEKTRLRDDIKDLTNDLWDAREKCSN